MIRPRKNKVLGERLSKSELVAIVAVLVGLAIICEGQTLLSLDRSVKQATAEFSTQFLNSLNPEESAKVFGSTDSEDTK